MELLEAKRPNLALACAALDGLLIGPGEVLSFWHSVGAPVKERGFQPGLVISGGKLGRGVGGGLCQVANALHWVAIHSDLQVQERHRHSLDLFPDDDRRVPFGTGATVVFNYRDLRLFNPGPNTYQLKLWLDGESLHLQMYCSGEAATKYEVIEKNALFENTPVGRYRSNQIVRRNLESGQEAVLFSNRCRCLYEV